MTQQKAPESKGQPVTGKCKNCGEEAELSGEGLCDDCYRDEWDDWGDEGPGGDEPWSGDEYEPTDDYGGPEDKG